MKSIVFDNAGTILERVTALLDMSSKKLLFETNTIGITNQNNDRIIVVIQTPTPELIKEHGTIHDFLKEHPTQFEISYSHERFSKEDVINAVCNDKASIDDIKTSAKSLIGKYNIEICSGSALIIDMKKGRIDYVYTAGGMFFKDTRNVIDYINKLGLNIYIASGDNKQSLSKIASILNIPQSNIFDTRNTKGKQEIVEMLQKNGNYVYMVGNNTNDQLAIKQANCGILTLEQGETVPNSLIKSADYIINSIIEVIHILKED